MAASSASSAVGALAGRSAAVFGFASTRSIAWGVASAWHAAGAALSIGIASERFRPALTRATAGWARQPHVVAADACDDASLDAAFRAVADAHDGRLHALLHSIAFAPASALRHPFSHTTRAEWASALDVSAYSFVAMAARAAPLMTADALAGGGRAGAGGDAGSGGGGGSSGPRVPPGMGGCMLTMSYDGSARVVPAYGVMGPAKAALEASARALAAELGPTGIRVNVVSPGPIDTLAARGIPDFTRLREDSAASAPLRRGVTLDDIGGMAAFLASDAGAGVTGQVLRVDCGASAVMM